MTSQRNFVIRFGLPGTAAVAAAATGATPALAAALDAPFAVNDPLLLSSIALLVVAMCVRVVRRARDADAATDVPDLRWWKNR